MTLYLKWYQKQDRSKLKSLNLLIKVERLTVIFLIPLEVQDHTLPHLKALRYGKDGSRELSSGSTFSIYQGILKSDNLLHKRVFVKTQSLHTVPHMVVLLHILYKKKTEREELSSAVENLIFWQASKIEFSYFQIELRSFFASGKLEA